MLQMWHFHNNNNVAAKMCILARHKAHETFKVCAGFCIIQQLKLSQLKNARNVKMALFYKSLVKTNVLQKRKKNGEKFRRILTRHNFV